MNRPRIYLAGPITLGDREHNFQQSCEAQWVLMNHGMAVLNPMLSMRHPRAWEISHQTWMENDLPWVEAADGLLRLPGQSDGADAECDHARECGIQVFSTIPDQLSYFFHEWGAE